VFILGDLFDLWLGDDDDSEGYAEVCASLRQLSGSGTALYVMRGNHDFTMGDGFARLTGATFLDDPAVVELQGRSALLMHGDTLCTADTEYQAYRARIRNPHFVADFLARPLEERRSIAADIRAQSDDAVRRKPPEVMDVTEEAVAAALRAADCDLLIHGHTHRPGDHRHGVDGREARRIVLGDWYQSGSALVWDERGPRTLYAADWYWPSTNVVSPN
jgi:UDP-2,3-diacylglucosamine hydrolase